MKALLIYSGQARTFRHVWANHAFWLWRHFPGLQVVASVADDEDADSIPEGCGKANVPCLFEKVVQPEIPEPDEVCAFHAATPRSSPVQAILRQFWANQRAWEFAKQSVNMDDYEVFIRCRPDIAFTRFVLSAITTKTANWPTVSQFMEMTIADEIQWQKYVEVVPPTLCLTPWWGRWGGVNDRFAILGRQAAEAYFSVFQNREALWADFCPIHPETMLKHHLERSGITPSPTLKVEFIRVRNDGTWVGADVSAVDIVDARLAKG